MKRIVDRPYEVIVHKPKIEVKIEEEIEEVPGEASSVFV